MMLDLSVIIPCRNEKDNIGRVVESLRRELDESGFRYEVIVVDNGSTDGSDAVAKNLGVDFLRSSSPTIAGVRNFGAETANGAFFVFLDADVMVLPSWGTVLRDIHRQTNGFQDLITGSNCTVPENIGPLLASWYKAISSDTRNTHLGSGHMVVSADTFRKIRGFDAGLTTGEDYDFCSRAKKSGVSTVNNPGLEACHLGYPANMKSFLQREIWHGQGDCRSLKTLFESRIALFGILFLVLHVIMLSCLFFDFRISIVMLFLLCAEAAAVNYFKFGFKQAGDFLNRCIVSHIYLLGRGLSLPAALFHKLRRAIRANRKTCAV